MSRLKRPTVSSKRQRVPEWTLVGAIDGDRSVGDSPTFCVAHIHAKEGESPTFCVALIHAIDGDRSVGDSPTFCVAAKEGDSPHSVLLQRRATRPHSVPLQRRATRPHSVLPSFIQRRATRPPSFTRQMTINNQKALPHSKCGRAFLR